MSLQRMSINEKPRLVKISFSLCACFVLHEESPTASQTFARKHLLSRTAAVVAIGQPKIQQNSCSCSLSLSFCFLAFAPYIQVLNEIDFYADAILIFFSLQYIQTFDSNRNVDRRHFNIEIASKRY